MNSNFVSESLIQSMTEEYKQDIPEISKPSSRLEEVGQIKIVVVGILLSLINKKKGPSGSGKSSVIQSIMGKPFEDDIKSTNCYEIHCKKIQIQNKELDMRLWDCNAYHYQSYSGVKKVLHTIAFYRSAAFALIVLGCNQTDDLISQLQDWVDECRENEVYQTIVILNKADLIKNQSESSQINIQLPSLQQNDTVTQNDFEHIKDDVEKAIPNIKVYIGSAKDHIKNGIPYPDLIKDLIKGMLIRYF